MPAGVVSQKGGGNGRAAARTAPRSTGAGSFHVRKRRCSGEPGRGRAARDRQLDWTVENVFLGERRMMPHAGIPLDNQWERWPRITYALPCSSSAGSGPSTAPRSPVGKGVDCGGWGDAVNVGSWHNLAALATGQPVRLLGQCGLLDVLHVSAVQLFRRHTSKLSSACEGHLTKRQPAPGTTPRRGRALSRSPTPARRGRPAGVRRGPACERP
jgi:ribosomal protein L37E